MRAVIQCRDLKQAVVEIYQFHLLHAENHVSRQAVVQCSQLMGTLWLTLKSDDGKEIGVKMPADFGEGVATYECSLEQLQDVCRSFRKRDIVELTIDAIEGASIVKLRRVCSTFECIAENQEAPCQK